MKVAPATSSERSSFSEIASKDGTKKSSQTIASAVKSKIKHVYIFNDYLEAESGEISGYVIRTML